MAPTGVDLCLMRLLRKLPIDGFVLSILATVALASVFPVAGAAATILDGMVKAAIALLFFLYGTRLSPAEAMAGARHWRLHLTVLAVTFVVFPLIGLALRVLTPHVLSSASTPVCCSPVSCRPRCSRRSRSPRLPAETSRRPSCRRRCRTFSESC